jgi:hypothetical protein
MNHAIERQILKRDHLALIAEQCKHWLHQELETKDTDLHNRVVDLCKVSLSNNDTDQIVTIAYMVRKDAILPGIVRLNNIALQLQLRDPVSHRDIEKSFIDGMCRHNTIPKRHMTWLVDQHPAFVLLPFIHQSFYHHDAFFPGR